MPQRWVALAVQEVQGRADDPVRAGVATVSPGAPCPPDEYHYTLFNTNHTLRVTGRGFGFGNPRFSWSVNGHALGPAGSTPVVCPVVSVDPASVAETGEQEVNIGIYATGGGGHGIVQATISIDGHPGDVVLPLEVSATDARVDTDATTTNSRLVHLTTQRVQYEDRYYTDGVRCRERLRKLVSRSAQFRVPFFDYRPDPPPREITVAGILLRLAANSTKTKSAAEDQLETFLTVQTLSASTRKEGARAVSTQPPEERHLDGGASDHICSVCSLASGIACL
jgi:hypothetical protein